ncbi:HIT family protein, partial [bacterium M21]
SDEILSKALIFAKPIAQALDELINCERVAIIVAGLEVPHAHIHLIPFNAGHELTFERAAPAEQDDLCAIAEQLRSKLQ